ncbi:MAG: hypothetical protein ABIV51_10285 [Saprospiraceae bacterium]
MIGKFKRWLGIEGVRAELVLPDTISANSDALKGEAYFYSLHTQEVQYFTIRVIEKYTRGRRKGKLINEYPLGEMRFDEPFTVPKEIPVKREFEIPITILRSEMDDFGSKNVVFKGFVKAAKFLKNAHSEYRVELEAFVEGTRLNPVDKKVIKIGD